MTTTEPSKSEIVPFQKKVATIRALLERSKPQMALALPRHLSVDRMLRVAMTAIQRNPKLLECTQTSLLAALMQGAQLGLEPDGVLGEAHLVPYKKIVQFIPGYKGLMKLARNSREISTIFASEVYQNDKFSFAYGLDPKLEHVPTDQEDPGPIIAFYAISKLRDGGAQFVVMWKRQVDGIRDKSAGYLAAKKYDLQSPWETHYAEMGKKTAIRRLCKYLPSNPELQKAVALDEMAEAGIEQNLESIIDITDPAEEPKSKLDEVVEAGTKQEAEDKKPTETNLGDQIYQFCRNKGMTDADFSEKLASMNLEDKNEVRSEHMKKLLEWATTWERPKTKELDPKKNPELFDK